MDGNAAPLLVGYGFCVVIEPGGTALGTVTFSVPGTVRPQAIQIVLDASGTAAAQWRIN